MSKSAEDRFWPRVNKTESCWVWTGAINKDTGYGAIGVGLKVQGTHRLSWELHNGPIPKGLCVLHKCDNRPCVNPLHLFLGTKADNLKDMTRKGRHGCTKLKPDKVLEIRKRFAAGGILQRELAGIYSVTQQTISMAVNCVSHKHLARS